MSVFKASYRAPSLLGKQASRLIKNLHPSVFRVRLAAYFGTEVVDVAPVPPEVDAMIIGKDGGGPFTMRVHNLDPGTYAVLLGPSSDQTHAYSGIQDAENPTAIEFVQTDVNEITGVMYLRPHAVGVYAPTFVDLESQVESTAGIPTVQYIAACFRNRALSLRRVLPPWYKAGIRDPSIERFPQ